MNIVKVRVDKRVATLNIPSTILRDLPSGVTHMTVETILEPSGRIVIVYKPLELAPKKGK
jgi:hypothetical protein